MPDQPPAQGYHSRALISLPLDPTLAFLFPGQGSQKAGMGQELLALSPTAEAVFHAADSVLGEQLSALCFGGPDEELTRTVNAQPALLATSIAYLAAGVETGFLTHRPALMAGHSLGEFTSLVAAGALTLADGLRLVRERGRLMEEAGRQQPGTMAAIVGLAEDIVEGICADSGAEMCNYNAPGQIVIGGRPEAVAVAAKLAREAGGRGLPLNVSGAFHTSLMTAAAAGLSGALDAAPITDPACPVVSNVTAQPLTTSAEARHDLKIQLTSPVRWAQTVDTLVAAGITRVVEIGPGRVLIGQIKRSHPGVTLAYTEGMIAESSANV
jgi:[acyl-carrier-protein] S-malonyltransferase